MEISEWMTGEELKAIFDAMPFDQKQFAITMPITHKTVFLVEDVRRVVEVSQKIAEDPVAKQLTTQLLGMAAQFQGEGETKQ